MKKILFAVLLFCGIAVNTARAQQHNKGVSGLSLSGIGLYTSSLTFGGELMYSHYLSRSVTLQGGAFYDRTTFVIDKNTHPIDTYGVRADVLYLLTQKKSFYLNIGAGVGLGIESVSWAKKRLQEQYIVVENLKNRFLLGLDAKLQAEYFVFPEFALICEGKGMYRPFANSSKFIPALSLGIKKLF